MEPVRSTLKVFITSLVILPIVVFAVPLLAGDAPTPSFAEKYLSLAMTPSASACGDGIINLTGGESCDAGVDGDSSCNSNCVLAACGDGVIDSAAGEVCDEGGGWSVSCNADCTTSMCGDGVHNALSSELCDDAGDSASCDVDCSPVECGDRHVNTVAGEQCDDGNRRNGDGCSAACRAES